MVIEQLTEEKLKCLIETMSTNELLLYMEDNIVSIFSLPDFPKLYRILKDIDIQESKLILPKLIISWMAFLSGDHHRSFMLMNNIQETELSTPQESSMFYALKSLMSSMLDIKDAFRYGKMAIDLLPKEEKSIYMANALLTYGQLCSGTDQYLLASEIFARSYDIFYSLDLHFLAAVAFVNEVLNLYKIGEYKQVMKKCQKQILVSGSFNDTMKSYWDIIHLPLGICYYEFNKAHIALQHLEIAKHSIDQFDLFHMYGLTEIYMFKSYYLLNNQIGMEKIKNTCIKKFSHMKHPFMDLLIIMFTIYSSKSKVEYLHEEIEKLEMEHLKGEQNIYSGIVELLFYLKLKGLSDVITSDELIIRLKHFNEIKNISFIQQTLLQLSELALLENKAKLSVDYLNEAVQIYKKYGISANFYLIPLTSITLIKKLDMKLYNELLKSPLYKDKTNLILSKREKDIMKLMAQGMSNDEVSQNLFISIGTVKWHINNIFSKLEVKNRVQAIDKAQKLGEIQ